MFVVQTAALCRPAPAAHLALRLTVPLDCVYTHSYNKPYIMAIKNNPRGYAGPKAEVVIYMVTE